MASLACGSGDSAARSPSTSTDTNSTDTEDGSSTDENPPSPGDLPNLSTDGDETADSDPEPEPPDCEVVGLTGCVTDALDELSGCLDAGHGGSFAEDNTRCDLTEADAVVTFSQAVPRYSTAFPLTFVLNVAGRTCASYAERATVQGFASGIDLITAQHTVTLETADDLQQTLTCDGVAVSFRRSNLSKCSASSAAPTPELADQTLDSVYQVFPMQESNRRIFNCQFPPNG